ncbi:unnamed protein product [Rangifer tarandus platyrhynchus]|uniref:Uncharacterized protein n=1 Tax=Rangifer tarandus platyrhynchus TaxID=3082113 RepID=A0AC60A7W7_RANTA
MEPGLAHPLFPGAGKSDSSSRGPSSLLSPSPNANAKFQRTGLGTEPSRLEQLSWGLGGGARGWGPAARTLSWAGSTLSLSPGVAVAVVGEEAGDNTPHEVTASGCEPPPPESGREQVRWVKSSP